MKDLRRIIWLASYPKSGNTWTRVFLANYLANASKPLTLDEMTKYSTGDAIARLYDNAAGKKVNRENFPLVLSLRDRVLQNIVASGADAYLVKTHSARMEYYGVDLIPPRLSRSAIYIMRNPLDMVVSSARHYGVSLERAVEIIGTRNKVLAPSEKVMPVMQGSWSEHVQSWTSFAGFPVVVLKYEDMLSNPQESFGKMLTHLGIPIDHERLDKAIRFSSFKELKKQEKKTGFSEKPEHAKSFFASGKSDQWKTALSPELVDRICNDHGETMKKFGYLE
jgi:hypothetical protein